MLADEIHRLIEASPLAPRSASIMAQVRPAVRLRAFLAEDGELPAGASRLGGRPDLPAGFPWPENDGDPLTFLAQIEAASFDEGIPLQRLRERPDIILASGPLAAFLREQALTGFEPVPWGFM